MTEREALKLALEALEKYAHDFGSSDLSVKAMYVARNALAQPDQLFEENERLHVENRRLIDRIETIGVPVGVGGYVTTTSQPEQEPVAWAKFSEKGNIIDLLSEPDDDYTPLYTTPPQSKPLTDEEIILIVAECAASHQHTDIHFARAIERAHGIKELV